MERYLIRNALKNFDTPFYLYNKTTIEENVRLLKKSLIPNSKLFYSMKANPLIGICEIMKANECGIEVASKGELHIALKAGILPENIIFTSPGKTHFELAYAIEQRIKLINIESYEEACIINELAALNKMVMPIALRINPKISYSNAKIKMSGVSSQFGIEEEDIDEPFMFKLYGLRNINLIGIQVYMGTQILVAEDIIKNTEYIVNLALRLKQMYQLPISYLNLGGGFGIPYFPSESALNLDELKDAFAQLYDIYKKDLVKTELIFESGRFLMAEAGVFVTKVLYCKNSKGNKYVICDAGSNFHSASAFLGRFVRNNFPMFTLTEQEEEESVTVTGPLCTPTDIIGQHVILNKVEPGDCVIIEKSGAYGLTHSPVNFLSHNIPMELLANEDQYIILRERGTVDSILMSQNSLHMAT